MFSHLEAMHQSKIQGCFGNYILLWEWEKAACKKQDAKRASLIATYIVGTFSSRSVLERNTFLS